MARGHPDYNVPDYTFFAVETPISDVVSERQGFSRLDNRGRVIWFEDFRQGINRWTADYDASESQVAHKNSVGLGFGYYGSISLDPLSNGGFASLHNSLILPVSKRIGIEVGVHFVSQHGLFRANFEHNNDGIARKVASLRVKEQTGEFCIDAVEGLITFFTPANTNYYLSSFVAMKYVIDVSTGKYIRAMAGNVQYDLSAYSLKTGALGMVGDTSISVECDGQSAVYKNGVYIGYVVISGDEP